jgi:tRNA threonylcarbamoyladenosine biosynthesis protein TsaE
MQITYTLNDIPAIVKSSLIPLTKSLRIFTLAGNLGAGKTTIIKEFFKQLGVKEHITSPTFAYVNSYQAPSGITIHHFDLYRLGSIQDFFAAGFDEYLNQEHALCFIEWPGIIENFLQSNTYQKITCALSVGHNQSNLEQRILTIKQ